MNIPKITPAQIIAALGFIADQAVAYGWLNPGTAQTLVSVAGVILPAILMVADAVIHHAYAKINVAAIAADAEKAVKLFHHSPTSTPTSPVKIAPTAGGSNTSAA